MISYKLVITIILFILEFTLINIFKVQFPIDVLNIQSMIKLIILGVIAFLIIVYMISTIVHYNYIHNLKIEKLEERETLIYLIWFVPDEDIQALNKWIAEYNQWVIKVNADKKAKHWFSKYAILNMKIHKIIKFI